MRSPWVNTSVSSSLPPQFFAPKLTEITPMRAEMADLHDSFLVSEPDGDPPSLFDGQWRRQYLEDEERHARGEVEGGWPPWLRKDWREFVAQYLRAHKVSNRRLSQWLGKSTAFVSNLLSPKMAGKEPRRRFRYHALHGSDLEVLIDLLELPDVEQKLLRNLVYLETARQHENGQADTFLRRIELAWTWETSYLPQDEVLSYARSFLNVVVHGMMRLKGFTPDPTWMRQHMAYPFKNVVSEDEVHRAWLEVKRLGMVELVEGRWRYTKDRSEAILMTGTPKLRETLKDFYRATIDASREGLALDSERRHYQCRTVNIRRDAIEDIRDQIHQLLGQIEEAEVDEGEVVFHVQMTAFTVADIQGRPPELEPLRPALVD